MTVTDVRVGVVMGLKRQCEGNGITHDIDEKKIRGDGPDSDEMQNIQLNVEGKSFLISISRVDK